MDAGNGNVLAFFEIPNPPAMGRDPNTLGWVRQIAFKLDSVKWEMLEELSRTKRAPKQAAWMHEREFAGTTAAG